MARPFPSTGTDAEKRAWAKEQNEGPAPKKSTSPSSGNAAPQPKTPTPEAQIEELYKRKPGYNVKVKPKSDSFWQSTDEHQ